MNVSLSSKNLSKGFKILLCSMVGIYPHLTCNANMSKLPDESRTRSQPFCILTPFPYLILQTLARQPAIFSQLLLCLPRLISKNESFQLPVRFLLVIINNGSIM